MTIFSLYIFDRHCNCVYYQDWHNAKRPKPAREGTLPPAVSRAVSYRAPEKLTETTLPTPSIRTTLSSSTGTVVAVNSLGNGLPSSPLRISSTPTDSTPQQPLSSALSFDEEVKLVYGVVLSLRNMVKKISGRDEQFVGYRTSSYKMHFFETLTGYKFILLSHPSAESMRHTLRQLYAGPFLEYVVRNPLVKMDSRDRGIDNELFRQAIDRLVRSLPAFT